MQVTFYLLNTFAPSCFCLDFYKIPFMYKSYLSSGSKVYKVTSTGLFSIPFLLKCATVVLFSFVLVNGITAIDNFDTIFLGLGRIHII